MAMRQNGGSTGAAVAVIGAGAAGLMAAIFAARSGRRVVLLERTRDGGRKILISGGGRCNVLPSELSPWQYVTGSSANTLKKMLLSWPLSEQRAFFERDLGIALALEPETGKLFPVSNRAREVRDRLVEHARSAGVETWFEAQVVDLIPRSEGGWRIELANSEPLAAERVIVATGGLSVPQTGSDGRGLRVLEALGHTLNPTYPALTPLTADPPVHAPLAGISLEVAIAAPQTRGVFETGGGFLFTHRGYSGPSVLNVSHLAVQSRMSGGPSQPVLVRWTALDGAAWESALVDASGGTVSGLLRRHLPHRLADALIVESEVDPQRGLAHLRREERNRLVELLARYPLPWTGDEGYKKAEVTGGGVALSEVHPRTMESSRHSGLYLCGEVLDAFGPIGGYNFAWAWATGRAAGLGVAAGGA
jgi:predicted Rossmann fold flavoprotein